MSEKSQILGDFLMQLLHIMAKIASFVCQIGGNISPKIVKIMQTIALFNRSAYLCTVQ